MPSQTDNLVEKSTEKSKSRVREFGKNIINMFGFNRKTATKSNSDTHDSELAPSIHKPSIVSPKNNIPF